MTNTGDELPAIRNEETVMPDYAKMDGGEFLQALGTDGQKWAQAFLQINPNSGLDEGAMIGWFANAIMAGHDAALGNPPLCGDHAQWMIDNGAA